MHSCIPLCRYHTEKCNPESRQFISLIQKTVQDSRQNWTQQISYCSFSILHFVPCIQWNLIFTVKYFQNINLPSEFYTQHHHKCDAPCLGSSFQQVEAATLMAVVGVLFATRNWSFWPPLRIISIALKILETSWIQYFVKGLQ